MYARDLMTWLHERLGDRGAFDQAQRRFESLRGYNLLPRGRENAGVRLSNEQIANAVLGFAHPKPGFAGHAALILGDLRPVGGVGAALMHAPSLQEAIAALIEKEKAYMDLTRLVLSVEHDFKGEDYKATAYFCENSIARTVSYVSKYAARLGQAGADEGYNHERLDKLSAVQMSLSPSFFQALSREVSLSRHFGRPLKTDWQEYETEEEKAEFHRKLGARTSANFMNLRVDAQVTWPKEPIRIKFGGHHLVLFPETQTHSRSISIDLRHERISADDARSLMNRLLSIMSWCDNRPASLHEGWSGNPVPVPVPKRNLAFATMNEWLFYRTLPQNEELMRCLAYYRDGLNAYSVGLASHAVLSFFRVFETKYDTRPKVERWVDDVFPEIEPRSPETSLKEFYLDKDGVEVGAYIYRNCRVATAHAARDVPSDPDKAEETRRLLNASAIMRRLARHFIEQEFQFSASYLTDNAD